jgi:polar amino acid transport system substrate-binding protein
MITAALTAACAEPFPRDPRQTLQRIETTQLMRVGVTENPPWVVRGADGQPTGPEVELALRIARAHRAEVQWHWGQAEALFMALAEHELDLMIGGVDSQTPWSDRLGLTRPWFDVRWSVGIDAARDHPTSLEDVAVAVAPGTAAAAKLAQHGARPVRTANWRTHEGPIMAPNAHLTARGMHVLERDLHAVELVFAVPPGENRWLGEVERTIRAQSGELHRLANEALR